MARLDSAAAAAAAAAARETQLKAVLAARCWLNARVTADRARLAALESDDRLFLEFLNCPIDSAIEFLY